MSDTSPPNGNGTHNHITITSAAHKLGSQIISALSPPLIVLVVLNLTFLGLFMWYVDKRANNAGQIMQQLLDACLKK